SLKYATAVFVPFSGTGTGTFTKGAYPMYIGRRRHEKLLCAFGNSCNGQAEGFFGHKAHIQSLINLSSGQSSGHYIPHPLHGILDVKAKHSANCRYNKS